MKRKLLIIVLLIILTLSFTVEYEIYIPLVTGAAGGDTPIPAPANDIFNVRDYGAVGNGVTDDYSAIQSTINALPENGGIVFFPPGAYAVSKTIVLSGDGITLSGSGQGRLGYMWGPESEAAGATILKWIGVQGGTVLKVGDGYNPNAGCKVNDLVLDGNSRASNLIIADATYYLRVENISGYGWRDGFAATIKHSPNVIGAGEKFHTWSHVTFVNPYQNGSGLDISSGNSANVNQLRIESSTFGRSNVDNYQITSLRLGYADHIVFSGCLFMPSISAQEWGEAGGQFVRNNPYSITVKPTSEHPAFPMNITFYGSAVYGGINYINTVKWIEGWHNALVFLPYYTADYQVIPPNGFINGKAGTLPHLMVGGFTDRSERIN